MSEDFLVLVFETQLVWFSIAECVQFERNPLEG